VRISRSVLREAGGETPPAYSPVMQEVSGANATTSTDSRHHTRWSFLACLHAAECSHRPCLYRLAYRCTAAKHGNATSRSLAVEAKVLAVWNICSTG
jgi:hypothetical protein